MEKTVSYAIREDIKQFNVLFEKFATRESDAIDQRQEKFFTCVQQQKENVATLEQQIAVLQQQISEQQSHATVEQSKYDEMKSELDSLTIKLQEMPAQIEKMAVAKAEKEFSLQQQREDISHIQKTKAYQVNELTKGVLFFKKRLGLEFVCSSDGHLQIIFRLIDPKQPQRAFTADVLIDDSNSYCMTHCSPQVNGVESLITTLNQTNDFHVFVHNMRSLFKQYVAAEQTTA
jgi:Chromosome segregation protein Spc25